MRNLVYEYGEALANLCEKIEHILSIVHPGFPHSGVIGSPYLTVCFDNNEASETVHAEIDTYQYLNHSTMIRIPSEYFTMSDSELLAAGAFLL